MTVSGLTIRNGKGAAEGGGIRCEGSALALRDVVLDGNAASSGGGLYASACAIDVATTRFSGNNAEDYGGGAFLVGSTGQITGSTFTINKGVWGGGLTLQEGAVALRTSNVTNNQAALQGGGLFLGASSEITGTVFDGNSSGWTAGGISSTSTALPCAATRSRTARRSTTAAASTSTCRPPRWPTTS